MRITLKVASWGASSGSAGQETPCLLLNPKLIHMFIEACHWFL
jgi:hypothetical protein